MRFITGNASTEIPSRFIFLNIEGTRKKISEHTNKQIETFRVSHIISVRLEKGKVAGTHSQFCSSPFELWQKLDDCLSKRNSNWVIADGMYRKLTLADGWKLFANKKFNLGESSSVQPKILPDGKKIRQWRGLAVLEDKPFFIRCRSSLGTIVFADFQNYFPGNLSDIADKLGRNLPTLPNQSDSLVQWEEFCQAKNELIKELLCGTIQKWKEDDKGNWNYTIPGLAYNNWKHCHAPKATNRNGKKVVPVLLHENEEVRKLEQAAYHGGEIQSFFIGYVSPTKDQFDKRPHSSDTLFHLDCRSLFPFSMRESLLPYCLHKRYEMPSLEEAGKLARDFGIVAQCRISSPKWPMLIKNKDGFRYVIGDFDTVLCADEFNQALKMGLVKKIEQLTTYKVAYLFRDFVDYWYKEKELAKKENRLVDCEFAKLVMNSLYGKFAQQSSNWVDRPDIIATEDFGSLFHISAEEKKLTEFRFWAGNTQQKQEKKPGKNSFVAISAFIVSNARCYMRRIRDKLGVNSVYYQHTDSFIVNQFGFDRLGELGLIGNKLGQFREVDSVAHHAEFFGPGDYTFGDKIVRCGMKPEAEIIDNDTIRQNEINGPAELFNSDPNGQVTINSKLIQRNRDKWKSYATQGGWVLPFSFSPLPSLPSQQLFPPSL